jgi:predicted nuclease with TOPRIM domain
MSDTPEDLVLVLLRGIRTDMTELRADMLEVKERLGLLEAQYSSISRRVDRVGGDIERIKRRLEIAEETTP